MTRRPSEPKTSERRLSAAEKQVEAVSLRKAGHTIDEIAARVGYSGKSGAYKAVMSALRKTLQEPADELRTLEVERLDAMLNALWPTIIAQGRGTPRAVEAALKVMDRRAALLGLDAPKVVEDHRTVQIEIMAEKLAAESGLDKNEIIAEAERIVAQAIAEGAA